jgi:hypothetical protein
VEKQQQDVYGGISTEDFWPSITKVVASELMANRPLPQGL